MSPRNAPLVEAYVALDGRSVGPIAGSLEVGYGRGEHGPTATHARARDHARACVYTLST